MLPVESPGLLAAALQNLPTLSSGTEAVRFLQHLPTSSSPVCERGDATRGWGFSAWGWRGWEALAAAANAIFKPSVAMPAGAAHSEVGSQPSVLRGKVFGVSSRGLTLCFPAVRAACLSLSSPRWENVLSQSRRSA